MKKRNQFVALAATAALATTVAAPAMAAETSITTTKVSAFPDVLESHGHYATIMELAERGIIKGFPDGTFKPGNAVTRGQAAKMIAGILGLDTTNVENPNFKDISTDFQYYGAIAALVKEGIINGYEDNTYRPNATLTRGHMAKILTRAFDLKADDQASPFEDIATSEYKNDIEALYDNKVTVGTTATTFSPRANVTRAQLSSFIIRGEDAVAFELVEVKGSISKIFEGVITIDGVEYRPDETWEKFFSTDNAAALIGAEIVLTAQKTNDGNVIKAVKSLKLKQPNTTFDAAGLKVDSLELAAHNITLKNANAAAVKVVDHASVNIIDSTIGKLTLGVNAKAAFSGNNKVDALELPKGVDPASVITGLENLKDIPVTNYDPPTPPGGGGGGGGIITPPTDYETPFESIIPVIEGHEKFAEYKAIVEKFAKVEYTYAQTTSNNVTIDLKNDEATLKELRAAVATELQGDLGLQAFAQDIIGKLNLAQNEAIDAITAVSVSSTQIDPVTVTIPANKTDKDALAKVVADVKAAGAAAYNKLGEDFKAADIDPVTINIHFNNNTTASYVVDVK